MNREIDGVYFRIKRDDEWQYICFSDLTEEEMEFVMKEKNIEWVKALCIRLGKIIKYLGDEFDYKREEPVKWD